MAAISGLRAATAASKVPKIMAAYPKMENVGSMESIVLGILEVQLPLSPSRGNPCGIRGCQAAVLGPCWGTFLRPLGLCGTTQPGVETLLE